jgi:hypothetical protein
MHNVPSKTILFGGTYGKDHTRNSLNQSSVGLLENIFNELKQ